MAIVSVKAYLKVGYPYAITILMLLCLAMMFLRAGDFLVVNQTPRPSDAIIVLGGEVFDRVSAGVQLYEDRLGKTMIFTGGNGGIGGNSEAESMAGFAEQLGVPPQRILLDNRATTTYQNALFTKSIMLAHHFKSAIVVSSNYHMRRAQFMFDRVYHGTDIRLTYVAAPEDGFIPNRWWDNSYSVHITLAEYVKLIAALFGVHD